MTATLAPVTRDVEVTRRLFRSGESEYLIDGHQCRLKDIHELLMDTGLGAKAYAIIEQGKIGMILSSRPTDRRQLIEEAAGITKYKARRRSAELKLESAQLNLTRLDDIVFEVEKQKGALKRQAAKARRYTRLRDEMRRWEKVLFARRYHALADAIETARGRLADARENETAAAARLAEVETALATLRIEQTEADAVAGRIREDAHARELDINRREQQIALDQQQAAMLEARAAELEQERQHLEARREPERLRPRRPPPGGCRSREPARRRHRRGAGRGRGLLPRPAGHRGGGAGRGAGPRGRLRGAQHGHRPQRRHPVGGRRSASAPCSRSSASRWSRASWRASSTRSASSGRRRRERSAARRTACDAARVAKAASEVRAGQRPRRARMARPRRPVARARARRHRGPPSLARGAGRRIAPASPMPRAWCWSTPTAASARWARWQTSSRSSPATNAPSRRAWATCSSTCWSSASSTCRRASGSSGQEDAGRCGFIVGHPGGERPNPEFDHGSVSEAPAGTVRLQSVVRVGGPFAPALRAAIGDALIAESFETATRVAPLVPFPVATIEGDVFRGQSTWSPAETRPNRAASSPPSARSRSCASALPPSAIALAALADETAEFEQTIAHATAAIQALSAEIHRQEKAIVSIEAQVSRAAQDDFRVQQRVDLVATETRRVREEIAGLDLRQDEARDSIVRLDDDKRVADETFSIAVQRLTTAREQAESASRAAAEARAEHAALVERCAAAAGEVLRMEAAAIELEQRVAACARDITLMREQRERLLSGISEHTQQLDEDVLTLDELRDRMHQADERATELRAAVDAQDSVDPRRPPRPRRDSRPGVRAGRHPRHRRVRPGAPGPADVRRRRRLARRGPRGRCARWSGRAWSSPTCAPFAPPRPPSPTRTRPPARQSRPTTPTPERMTAEEAIAELRGKIDRIGPVNMMAIEQHAELETRHVFLTTQRQDLIDSIAQTNEAIKRIDETTHARFREAFTAINANFQQSPSRRFSAAAAPASACSTRPIRSRAASTSSPRLRASGCRA